ncbi:helicase-exonuclease AddAB subunit AddA [Companilactobacillus jidongensis]|uniref:helicase-exonuclease AddAB subunit AddA n=1 Tax=Companilactobacillus jidongensis TaxID=2486006 RepID=UPI000F7B6E02|nr:helicase-exonuclease AddAB subunit AddA [Companilactobacillus jidongensis]
MPKWTDDQNKAIFHHGHDILVSAAAGSGKTTILIERIIEMLKNGENVDNLLVSTFTEAAAMEMKDRLIARIKELLQDKELDKEIREHLQKQIFKIPIANISTLHAFCLSVIQKFYYVIDLDPNFRLISDDTEKSMLQEQAFDNVRNKYYEKNDEKFMQLTENFSDDRSDDGLVDVVFKLYDFAITNAKTDEWLDDLSSTYKLDAPFNQTDFYQKQFLPQFFKSLDQIISMSQGAINTALDDELGSLYAKMFKEMIEQVDQIKKDAVTESFDDLKESVIQLKFTSVPKVLAKQKKDMDLTIFDFVRSVKDDITKRIRDDLINDYFIQNETDTLASMNDSAQIIDKLIEVEHKFMKEFMRIKLTNHALDFNDLEHQAVQILSTKVDNRQIALDYYQSKFHEIMIDEYQDVNAMQENIIQLLANDDNNIFMVGDIKQSIYGFRQAAPYIFAHKYDEFQKDDNPNELVNLSMNFRSSGSVDTFVNNIFKKIFDRTIGDINYDKNSQLVEGTSFPEDSDTQNELYILTKEHNINQVTKRQSQIEFAAKRIKELMDSKFQVYDNKHKEYRDLKYSDIAILSRTKGNNTDLISYFSKAEIPLMVTDAQNYFQTTELQIMMAMLQIVDNPRQDIPLVAVLRSPIVGLNEEELAQIRLTDKGDDYYTAMKLYAEADNSDNKLAERLKTFFIQLETYRDFANKNSIARLIWKIYQETGILEYVAGMPGGKQRAANLHALYQRASGYEETNFKGLHAFIDFIQRMEKMKKDLSQPNSIEVVDDTVKVMTVHASKGLEFPIVIFLDLSHGFNKLDYVGSTLYDVDLGLGMTLLNTDTRITIPTIQRSLIATKKKVATVSEEMRLLYVALTRAKQKLIMIGFEKNIGKMFGRWDSTIVEDSGVIDEASRLGAGTYQNLIGMSTLSDNERLLADGENHYENRDAHIELQIVKEDEASKTVTTSKVIQIATEQPSKLFRDTVSNILNFKYQHQEAVETTAYQSVSEIKGLFADPDDDEMATDLLSDKGKYIQDTFAKPKFLAETKSVSAAEIGSATHLLLQKVNLEQTPTLETFEKLLTESIADGTIEENVGKRIDLQSLANLYQSDLGQSIVEHQATVSREFPFSVLMPAKRLFKNVEKSDSSDDKILVHGIIDGVIELEDCIILFDYKTDNVNNQNLNEAVEKYSGQLNLYAQAISVIRNKPVKEKYLYFLKIDQAVNLNKNIN